MRNFIHGSNFSDLNNFLYIYIFFKKNEFGTIGRTRPSGILQWKVFWKKQGLKLKKMKTKVFELFM